MSEISSGLVAVAHMMQSPDGKCMGFLPFEEEGTAPVVRLSDAEAIISKQAERIKLAREALIYHTEQTRPIQKTVDALAAIDALGE